jgi:hypothetical protein
MEKEQLSQKLLALMLNEGYTLETINTFARISNPANSQVFSMEEALKAFSYLDDPES